jgi:hypothetical protein
MIDFTIRFDTYTDIKMSDLSLIIGTSVTETIKLYQTTLRNALKRPQKHSSKKEHESSKNIARAQRQNLRKLDDKLESLNRALNRAKALKNRLIQLIQEKTRRFNESLPAALAADSEILSAFVSKYSDKDMYLPVIQSKIDAYGAQITSLIESELVELESLFYHAKCYHYMRISIICFDHIMFCSIWF